MSVFGQSRLRSRPDEGGFTLIEILVVVVIAGILSAIVLLSVNVVGEDRDLRQEARRMSTLIELAADEAVLQGRDFGIEFLRSGYRFVEYDPLLDRWDELGGDDLLRPRELPENYELDLFVEDRRVELAKQAPVAREDKERGGRGLLDDYAPHGLILSSGDVSPFDLQMIRHPDNVSLYVRVLETGEIKVDEGNDDLD